MDYENALWSGNIPMDLVKDILLRLPAKALGRCMCACKRWYSHIKSAKFIASHLNHSKIRDQSVLIVEEGCYSIFSESDPTLIKQESGQIPFPVMERDLYILGSCRGLVLLRLMVERGYVVLLWNPSVEKFKLVDTIIHDRPHGDADARARSSWSCVYALGFHEASNDYRVVRKTHGDVVDVYSLTNDNWHRVDGTLTNGKTLPSIANPRKMASYVNGAVHWLASYGEGEGEDGYWMAMYNLEENEQAMYEPERYVVLSFDFNNEVFKLIELHRRYIHDDHDSYPLELQEFNGKLALFICYIYPRHPPENYDTWVMMNYPLVESWTCVGCLFEHDRFYEVWPLVCTKKENCIYKPIWVKKQDVLSYFNAKEEKTYELEIVAPYECPVIVDFVDCLVMLDVENDTLEVRTP